MDYNFMKIVRRVVKKIFYYLHYIVPKNNKKVFFSSLPSFSDNARALYDHMRIIPKYSDYSFYWLIKDSEIRNKPSSNTYFINYGKRPDRYLIYLYHLYTSKYLFSTHNDFIEANPKLQTSVLLWHGSPIKRIYNMIPNNEKTNKNHFSYFLSSSEFYNSIFIESFPCRKSNMLTTGYPRNDLLFQESTIMQDIGIDGYSYSKIVIYMPTFRVSKGNENVNSKHVQSKGIIELFNVEQRDQLDAYLSERNILFIVKLHPSDSISMESFENSNIKVIPNELLVSKQLQFYHLLKHADALITDYSSVFCDYMLLSRPIAFFIEDIDEYRSSRGFIFDNVTDYLPGYIIKNTVDLKLFLNDIFKGVDKSYEKRESLQELYNKNLDGNSCSRLLRELKL